MSTLLETLAETRTHQSRSSLSTYHDASLALGLSGGGKGKAAFKGDEEWVILEQLAIASLDLGRVETASDCISRLSYQFPSSPRITVLEGMLLEALGKETEARRHYLKMVKEDPTSILAHRRLISLPSIPTKDRITVLLAYLDVFYTDVDGWGLLSELYASLGLYSLALTTLSHPLLLAPQNPLHYLRHAETAYTAGDLPLAFKSYLLCLSVSERPSEDGSAGKGMSVRAWWGVKLTTRALLSSSSSSSSSSLTSSSSPHQSKSCSSPSPSLPPSPSNPAFSLPPPSPKELQEFNQLSTRWLAKVYSSSTGCDANARRAVMEGFLGEGQRLVR